MLVIALVLVVEPLWGRLLLTPNIWSEVSFSCWEFPQAAGWAGIGGPYPWGSSGVVSPRVSVGESAWAEVAGAPPGEAATVRRAQGSLPVPAITCPLPLAAGAGGHLLSHALHLLPNRATHPHCGP